MSLETLETVLIEMIKEASNLPESELEEVQANGINSGVYVKKGRSNAFSAYAYQYYEMLNNVEVPANINYIKEINSVILKNRKTK